VTITAECEPASQVSIQRETAARSTVPTGRGSLGPKRRVRAAPGGGATTVARPSGRVRIPAPAGEGSGRRPGAGPEGEGLKRIYGRA